MLSTYTYVYVLLLLYYYLIYVRCLLFCILPLTGRQISGTNTQYHSKVWTHFLIELDEKMFPNL